MFLILIFIKIIINLNKNLIISVWIKPNQIHFFRIGFYENFGFCSIRSYSVRMLSRAIEHKKNPTPPKKKGKKKKKESCKEPKQDHHYHMDLSCSSQPITKLSSFFVSGRRSSSKSLFPSSNLGQSRRLGCLGGRWVAGERESWGLGVGKG